MSDLLSHKLNPSIPGQLQKGQEAMADSGGATIIKTLLAIALKLKEVFCLQRVAINCFLWATISKAKVKVR